MIDLPGGGFSMGSADDYPRAYEDERPRRRVVVAPFSISSCPVTQALYRELASENPGAPRGVISRRTA